MGSCGIMGSVPAGASSSPGLEVVFTGVRARFGFLLTPSWPGCQAYTFLAQRGLVGQLLGLLRLGLFLSYLVLSLGG